MHWYRPRPKNREAKHLRLVHAGISRNPFFHTQILDIRDLGETEVYTRHSARSPDMAFKLKLYTIDNDLSAPKYQDPLSATKDDIFATFRIFLENEGLIDFVFDLWIHDNKKWLQQRFKRFNVVKKEVFVIRRAEFDLPSIRKRKFTSTHMDFLNISYPSPDDLDTTANSEDIFLFPPSLSSKSPMRKELWLLTLFNLRICQKKSYSSISNQRQSCSESWLLFCWITTYGTSNLKIHCKECMKNFGCSVSAQNNHAISNMFVDFMKTHLYTAQYICNLSRQQGFLYNKHLQFAAPKGKVIIILVEDHRKAV